MNRVFLSHSSTDKDFVRAIAERLGDIAIIDERDFEAGSRTIDQIVEKIDKASIFVAFLSNKALASDWVQKELALAIQHCQSLNIEILIFSIDKAVDHYNKLIPEILRKNYNISYLKNPTIALSRINDVRRLLCLKNSPAQRDAENLFIGRGEEIRNFESDFSDITGSIPTFIVADNFYNGMGRTHFIKHGLNRINILKLTQSPLTISMQRGESLENFIIKLNAYVYNDEAIKADFHALSLENKKKIALNLVKEYKKNNRLIFIKDEGAIVLPNHEIVDWFSWLTQAPELHNRITFCLISTWSPHYRYCDKANKGVSYHLKELDSTDTQNLFINLLNIYGQRNLNPHQKKEFIDRLTGIPSQIIFTVQQIRIHGAEEALLEIEDISTHSDSYSATLLDAISKNSLAYQISLILANSIISLDTLTDVFGDSQEVFSALSYLKDYSALEFINGNITSVKLNPTLADFIKRRKVYPERQVQIRFDEAIKKYVSSSFDELAIDDYSKLMLAIEDCMQKGKPIPEKYYIAPLLINNIFKEYNAGHYQTVEKYCKNLLNQSNVDYQVQWELHYYLVRVYARTGRQEFWQALKNSPLSYIDKEFLKGFYFRNNKNENEIKSALQYFENVLAEQPDHRRARREIVNTYLLLEDYPNALKYAKGNYEANPSDLLHLQSYFTSLIRNNNLDPINDYATLSSLISNAKKNKDTRALDVFRCMEGEYAYYVNGNFSDAIRILNEAKKINENKLYPMKALLSIYRREGMMEEVKEIKKELSSL